MASAGGLPRDAAFEVPPKRKRCADPQVGGDFTRRIRSTGPELSTGTAGTSEFWDNRDDSQHALLLGDACSPPCRAVVICEGGSRRALHPLDTGCGQKLAEDIRLSRRARASNDARVLTLDGRRQKPSVYGYEGVPVMPACARSHVRAHACARVHRLHGRPLGLQSQLS